MLIFVLTLCLLLARAAFIKQSPTALFACRSLGHTHPGRSLARQSPANGAAPANLAGGVILALMETIADSARWHIRRADLRHRHLTQPGFPWARPHGRFTNWRCGLLLSHLAFATARTRQARRRETLSRRLPHRDHGKRPSISERQCGAAFSALRAALSPSALHPLLVPLTWHRPGKITVLTHAISAMCKTR